MVRRTFTLFSTVLSLSCVLLAVQLHSQPPADGPRNQSEGFPGGSGGGFPGGGPGGFLSGPGFPGGPGGSEVKILEKYDANKDGWLNTEERTEAKKYLAENPVRRGGPRGGQGGPPGGGAPGEFGPPGFGPPGFGPPGFAPPGEFPGGAGGFPGGPGGFPGGPGGMGRNRPAPEKGMTIAKSSVEPLTGNLYDNELLRTVFIDFEIDEWEKELETFHGTDVDVAATLTVDGQQLPNCGIHFRGMSSYSMVPAGYKRSLNVSVDMANSKQRLLGYKTLNLLNCNADSTMLSSVLYSKIAGQHIPTPKANLVRVVINGEDWGIHANVQQFNKEFLKEHFESSKGTRWKVSGSPMGGGGLDYRGDDPAAYQRPYEIKNDDKDAVTKLINLCRVLAQTPTEDLPAALEPIVDVEGLLWFLALDNALINSDGYWIRASDYSIFLDEHDKFHFVPHDMNESFRKPGGPGMGGPGMGGRGGRGQAGPGGQGGQMAPGGRGGPGGGMAMINGVELDPLIGLDDASKPLRSKVLAVPKYREQYLKNVREIAEKDLDWKTLGPFVESQVEMIDPIVKTETRMLSTYQEFVASTKPTAAKTNPEAAQRGGHGSMNLYEFAEARRKYLLRVTK